MMGYRYLRAIILITFGVLTFIFAPLLLAPQNLPTRYQSMDWLGIALAGVGFVIVLLGMASVIISSKESESVN